MIEREADDIKECVADGEGVDATVANVTGAAASDVSAVGGEAEETPNRQVKRTNCHFCGYLCGFLATVENGRIVDLKVAGGVPSLAHEFANARCSRSRELPLEARGRPRQQYMAARELG